MMMMMMLMMMMVKDQRSTAEPRNQRKVRRRGQAMDGKNDDDKHELA